MIEVLIVEDDPMVAELNRRYLERVEGFSLAGIAKNGEEALRFLAKQAVDLVLLDIFMPGMNGLECLAAIRQQQHGIDIILVTAARDAATVQTALRQGAADYLIKPFEFSRFQEALLRCRQRLKWIEKQEDVSQEELDKQFFTPQAAQQQDLPKGLDANTLKLIWQQIVAMDADFSAEEMAGRVGLSQVSMRKYLKYLQQHDKITAEIQYGAIGRPVYRYRCRAKILFH